MIIVASHGNADFDSFASMVAATKLHPGARILFTGSKERAVERFIANPYYEFDEVSLKEVVNSKLGHVILCDISTPERLGELNNILNRIKVKVTLYDHHRIDPADFPGAALFIEPLGSVTTILVKKIREARIPFSKMEATIFALGIYEDTGLLTYETTTPEDIRQAAFLLEKGADLGIVSKFLKNDLGPDQIELFNELIINARTHLINRNSVVISTASRDSFFHDAAAVVQKQMELENYSIYVAVIRMGDKVHLIGRSRNSHLDMGKLFRKLGGGGHPPAAHANVTGMTLVEVCEKILVMLKEAVPPSVKAKDIMTKNMLTISPSTPINLARKEMIKTNVNSVPILEDNIILGIVSRQQLSRAIEHKLKGTVSDFMNTDFAIVAPEESIDSAEEIIMQGTQRAVLVGDSRENILGIITRMDLFRKLYLEKQERKPDLGKIKYRKFDVVQMVQKRLHSRVKHVLRSVSEVSRERNEKVHLVGGIVRDLILNYPNQDVDLVVSGDGIAFAESLAKKLDGYSHPHKRFKTSVVVLTDGYRIDVVTSRSESYPYPGALPEVQAGNLRADLFRRDFTINALAIDLTPDNYGELIDYFGGMKDIRNQKIRILHGLSFIDDPTRILRGLRFASRFKFELSSDTKTKLFKALEKNMLKRLSGKRLGRELESLLDSPRIIYTLELLETYGVLSSLNSKIKLDRFSRELLINLDITLSWFSLTFPDENFTRSTMYLMVLFEKLKSNERSRLCNRLALSIENRETILNYKKQSKSAVYLFRRKKAPCVSQIYNLFSSFSLETILFIHAFANDIKLKRAISEYLLVYRHQKISLTGHDLKEMGLREGPAFRKVLEEVLNACLDGRVKTASEERSFAESIILKINMEEATQKS